MDYTNSQLVTMNSGQAKIQTGTFKLIHTINMDEYQELIDNLEETLHQKVNQSHFLYPFLRHELKELQEYLDRLKPKSKRSLNFLGSAWKWIAGSPDHDDFEILEKKTNKMLRNNNKQVVINILSIENFKEITKITNEILRNINSSSTNSIKEQAITVLKYKLDIIKEEIINIQYAMHWAKIGIINSFILSYTEINIIKDVINTDSIQFVNLEQAFEFAEVKIASNHDSIVYIISIPTTNVNSCNEILVKPIKYEKHVNKIIYNKILICDNVIFGVKNACKNYNNLTICNRKNLENLDNDTCLARLIKSESANCSLINNRNIPTVDEISPGTILLNNFNGTILINKEPRNLTGTFLVQFHNESVSISDQIYNSFETAQMKPLPAILQPRNPKPNIEEELSLEMVKEMQLNNTEAIDLLNRKNVQNSGINLGIALTAMLVLILVIVKSGMCKKENKSYVVPTLVSNQPQVHVSMPELSESKGNEPKGVTANTYSSYFQPNEDDRI